MQREQFDSHQIWAATRTALDRAREIEPLDDVESKELERIQFIMDYVMSHQDMGTVYAAFFTQQMLDTPLPYVTQVNEMLAYRHATAGHRAQTTQAVPQAEAMLFYMASWPRRYAKGGQVNQMSTLFENLLERQAEELEARKSKQAEVIRHLNKLQEAGDERADEVRSALSDLETVGRKVSIQIEAASGRIDEVVQNGLTTIDGLKQKNSEMFQDWVEGIDAEWRDDYKKYFDAIAAKRKRADEELESLKATVAEHEKLTSLSAADTLAQHFMKQAASSSWISLGLFVLGFLFLIAAAVPFGILLTEAGDLSDTSWPGIVLRLSFGVLAGSAATVAIRLGGRFSNEATASKRMEMELRTFGPFLATVAEQKDVDTARLELIDRAFGKSYVTQLSNKADEDTVPVSGLTQIIEAIGRLTPK
ncbi:hypothetical protein ACX80G_03385 [Arthrobacter sp. HLT1-21]